MGFRFSAGLGRRWRFGLLSIGFSWSPFSNRRRKRGGGGLTGIALLGLGALLWPSCGRRDSPPVEPETPAPVAIEVDPPAKEAPSREEIRSLRKQALAQAFNDIATLIDREVARTFGNGPEDAVKRMRIKDLRISLRDTWEPAICEKAGVSLFTPGIFNVPVSPTPKGLTFEQILVSVPAENATDAEVLDAIDYYRNRLPPRLKEEAAKKEAEEREEANRLNARREREQKQRLAHQQEEAEAAASIKAAEKADADAKKAASYLRQAEALMRAGNRKAAKEYAEKAKENASAESEVRARAEEILNQKRERQ